MQNLIFALNTQPDLIIESAIQNAIPALKQNEVTNGRPWFSIVCYCMQDLILALDAQPDLIFESAIQPAIPALKQNKVTSGRPYHIRAMELTKVVHRTIVDN